jgi:hypothetical protein
MNIMRKDAITRAVAVIRHSASTGCSYPVVARASIFVAWSIRRAHSFDFVGLHDGFKPVTGFDGRNRGSATLNAKVVRQKG